MKFCIRFLIYPTFPRDRDYIAMLERQNDPGRKNQAYQMAWKFDEKRKIMLILSQIW